MIYKTVSLLLLFTSFCSCNKISSQKELHMPSSSMEPTIPRDSVIIVDKTSYQKKDPERFDIVTFTPPTDAEASFIFRVIGLPNEAIEITKEGPSINGKTISLPDGVVLSVEKEAPHHKLKLGEGQYYLMGDNTKNALDSRYFGPVKREAILGKVIEIKKEP